MKYSFVRCAAPRTYFLLTIVFLLCGCAAHKPTTDPANAVPAKCLRLECREEDGCWYDRKAQIIHHEKVSVVCLEIAR